MNVQHILKRSFFIVTLLCVSHLAQAQNYKSLTSRIDSLAKLYLPKSALVQVDKLDSVARLNKNASMQVKAAIYRMNFQSIMEENALVAIISQLKRDIKQAEYPVKPVLQSLLASMYWNYYKQNRWQFYQRTRLDKPDTNFTKWDLQTINTQIANTFSLSLQNCQLEQQTPITALNGALMGDSATTRYLRPTLYDLLVQRAFEFFLSDEAGLSQPKNPFTLSDPQYFGNSQSFANLKVRPTDTSAIFYKGIQYLQQATLFHLQTDGGEPLADIDLKRLEFMQGHSVVSGKDSLYLKALRQVADNFSNKPIGADALVLIGKYFQQKNDLKSAYAYFKNVADTQPNTIGGENGVLYLKQIQHQELSAMVENINSPGKPLLSLLNYRNVKTAHVVIYKISATQYNELAKIPSDINRYLDGTTIYASDSVFKYLKKLTPVEDKKLDLPDLQDYQAHNTEFKINAAPSGHYVLTIRNDESKDPALTALTAFKVCRLAYVLRRDQDSNVEIRVTDRETGAPVQGVHVTLAETENSLTDMNGRCSMPVDNYNNAYSVKLTMGNDTLYVASNYLYNPQRANTVLSTIFFTDRTIYRPGQTVYFKGLYLQNDNGKNKLLPGESVDLQIEDNNGKLLTSIPVKTNDFGTFSGTYVLPQNILNGNVSLGVGNSRKYIRVEEYKRPGFQVTFLPVTGAYKPNDSVIIKGKVTAYSGYGLSQARVVYHITRNGSISFYDYRQYANYAPFLNKNDEVVTDTIKTDDQGLFSIKFKAITPTGVDLHNLNFTFAVNVDVTDGSGETRSANANVAVGLNNITLKALLPQTVQTSIDSIRLTANILNLNGSMQTGNIQVKIHALQSPGQLFKQRLWGVPNQYIMTKAEYKKDFPDYAYGAEENVLNWPIKNRIAELNKAVDKKAATFDLDMLKKYPTGTYKIIIAAKNAQGDTTSTVRYLYVINAPGKPEIMNNWVVPLSTAAYPGKPAEVLLGTGTGVHVLMEKMDGEKMLSSEWLSIPAGVQRLVKIPVTADQKGFTVQFLMIYKNRMYTNNQVVTNIQNNDKLDIKFMTFRNILQPGEKEEWKLHISDKNNERQMAEMVADLYDASLDEIASPDYWNTTLNNNYRFRGNYFAWGGASVHQLTTNPLKYNNFYFSEIKRNYEQLNLLGYNYYGGYNFAYRNYLSKNKMFGSVDKTDASDYKAEAYGVVEKKDLIGAMSSLNEVRIDEPVGNASVAIRGRATTDDKEFSTASSNALFAKVAGVQVMGDFGEQVTIGYGSPKNLSIPQINTRKNFAETAFFYPQLQTDEKGEIAIDFTIPESLTKWKFKGFAHTKDLKTGYIEQDIVTQKQLSINANMPRFLREGDTVTVSARLANLTTKALNGKVNLQLFNALNMQPVNILANPADAQQSFDIASATTKSVSFRLIIPSGLDALDYKLTADAGDFTDGEENTLPVLPNRMLVTESMPMMVRPGQTRSYTFDKLLNEKSATLKNKTLTLEYTENPTWYAVQALPYMMEFPYECSEQVFSRYYANSLATNIVNKMPVIKQVFAQWKSSNSMELLSNLEKNQELKATLIEETPWLRDAQNETQQKKNIALLFDLNKMSYELQQNLDKLQGRQLGNGGFPWFGGDKADRYITQHILAGIGQLYHLGITDTKDQQLKDVADKAMTYLDNQLIDDANWEKKQGTYENRSLGETEIHSYYTQSYFTARKISEEMEALTANYLQLAEKQWVHVGVYEESMIALTMLRNNKPDVAQAIIRSLLETAQQSDEMGMYWAKNQLGYYWYQSPIETQSLAIELFTEAGNQDKAIAEMKIWLLRNKQTTNWKTTKATAAACYALLLKGDNWLQDEPAPVIKLGGQNLSELKPDVKADAGTGYIKTSWTDEQIKPELGKVDIVNNGKTINWGAMHWQYLENLDKITPSTTDITLERKYFILKHTDAGDELTTVDATHQPKIGDLLKVVIYLKAGRDYEYLQLKDMRPAGTEPVDALSTYKYQDGLYYYQVTKDVATNFFISTLPKGNFVFEYRLRVAQPGNFSTGITSVQSMYAPEYNAHSEGMRLSIKAK